MDRWCKEYSLGSSVCLTPKTLVLVTHRTMTFAAMDTTSNALSQILHLLAQHPQAQDRLRAEVLEARHRSDTDDISYDELSTLPFLDAVCRETLRVYVSPALVHMLAARARSVVLTFSFHVSHT